MKFISNVANFESALFSGPSNPLLEPCTWFFFSCVHTASTKNHSDEVKKKEENEVKNEQRAPVG